MHVTDSPSSASVSSDEIRMSFQAIVKHVKPLIAKKTNGEIWLCTPIPERNCWAKIEKPASPAMAIHQ